MTSFIDISVSLSSKTPTWPGSPKMELQWLKQISSGDICNNAYLTSDIHTGTHVDAPLHFVEAGKSVEQLSLDTLVGPAIVVDLNDCQRITADDFVKLQLPSHTSRILLRTRNSTLWSQHVQTFQPDFVALTVDAAQWIVDQKIQLVGIDYLSIQRFHDGPEVHQILLKAGVIIVESLNLSQVPPGSYELICLPLKVLGAEGAPARAILRPLKKEQR